MGEIAPAIWQKDKLICEIDYSTTLISSSVMNDVGNETLRTILETGKADKKATDNYSKNYLHFQELLENASKNNALAMYDFIYALLNQAIMLPITTDTQDTALTIFSTLNDRGLQLSDADIFKAKIYGQLNSAEKAEFIEKWKALDEQAIDASESIQHLFYYYMFYLRAKEGNSDSTIQGARKYYADKSCKRLFEKGLIDDLFKVLNIWKVANQHLVIDGEAWSNNIKTVKTLDILCSYPNAYWKYPVIIYYLSHCSEPDFDHNFSLFLRKLLLELLTKYLVTPTINAVKTDILKLNVEIISVVHPKFDFKVVDESAVRTNMENPHKNAVRMLLKVLAYKKQDALLPAKWEIEHILPQKWQSTYFIDLSDDTIREKIEHIGNKLPFEKKVEYHCRKRLL